MILRMSNIDLIFEVDIEVTSSRDGIQGTFVSLPQHLLGALFHSREEEERGGTRVTSSERAWCGASHSDQIKPACVLAERKCARAACK